MSLSEDIKEFALAVGYSRAGITTADAFPEYIEDLNARHDMYSFYTARPSRPLSGAEPGSVMPAAKSIVVAVIDASAEAFPEKLAGRIGRVYQARAYLPPPEQPHGARRQKLLEFLERNGCRVDRELRVPERLAASCAGVATYGKNCFVFADGIGSFIIVNALVVDRELGYDQPTHRVKCPPDCTACIDACPTGALYEPLKIDPRRCIAFNHWITQDAELYPGGAGGYIPPRIREKMGGWIHGCDICQEVCPRNQKRLKASLPHNDFLDGVAADFELTKLLSPTDEFYHGVVQPLMYNYIRHRKYFQRNAAIALGNSGDPTFIPDLARAMGDGEGLVRGYAAWALGRIGGEKARRVLESSLPAENDGFAREEIIAALEAV